MSWEIFFPLGVLILGAVLAYAMLRSKGRSRAAEARTEDAVKANYDDPKGAPHGGPTA
jgi:hypothetical protein